MSAELKPCPFCGSDKVRIRNDYDADQCRYIQVHCGGCGAMSRPEFSSDPCALTHQEIRDDWNRRAAVPAAPTEQPDYTEIYDAFHIGSAVRQPHILLMNVQNAVRRTACLGAIERAFFMVETPPDPDEGDTEPGEECLLNWGSNPAEYVEQFRAALAKISGAQEVVEPLTEQASPEWEKLRSPFILFANLLRGFPAKLSDDHLLALLGEQHPMRKAAMRWHWWVTHATHEGETQAAAIQRMDDAADAAMGLSAGQGKGVDRG